MSRDCTVKPAVPDKELLVRRFGAQVASKLLSLDADIRLLYSRAVDAVGQDSAKIVQLAEPLCQYITEMETKRRHRRWKRLMMCLTVAAIFLLCLVACETSCRFIFAVARILWIKVDQLFYVLACEVYFVTKFSLVFIVH